MNSNGIIRDFATTEEGETRPIWQFNEVQLGAHGPIITEEDFAHICIELDKAPEEVTAEQALSTEVWSSISARRA